MSKKIILVIAVAMMLVAASSVYAYGETWGGWFNSGVLIYGGNNYTYSGSGGWASDTTNDANTHDLFYVTLFPGPKAFVYSVTNDTIWLTVSAFSGSKVTGQSGTKEGSGTWSGSARRTLPDPDQIFTSVVGTWDTNGATEYFDYRPATPTYSVGWDVTYSYPLGITGSGVSSGSRTNNW